MGVLIPCRNEAAVIERKLRNLAASGWPGCAVSHRIVIVDDSSTDGTADRARSVCERLFADPTGARPTTDRETARSPLVVARVVPHTGPPGKAGAIQTGISELERDDVDLIVLTDADVVFRPAALPAVETAFRTRPSLGMACGCQEFVRDLAADGSCDGADGNAPVRADEPYDRWTARVRRWESRRGLLFSVHGQLLAWRAELGLSPTPGIAADDLDLMFQVRERGRRVELLPDAVFLEVKPGDGAARDEQQLRRARAYIQVMAGRRTRAGAGLSERIQLLIYRFLPTRLPSALLPCLALLGVGTFLVWSLPVNGPPGPGLTLMRWLLSLALLTTVVLLTSPAGQHVRQLFGVIRAARRAETAGTLTDRWDRVTR
jgi:cellulose synthase/poly-beta-1,6-N-acetylglucosamine synthase-like glycosyltransferase